jgi:hypothetical protein
MPGLLSEAEQAVADATDATKAGAAGLLSRAYALNGWRLVKRDMPGEAGLAANQALVAARAADDVVCAGAALRCLGEVHLRAGRFDVACDLSLEAAEHVKRSGGGRRRFAIIGRATFRPRWPVPVAAMAKAPALCWMRRICARQLGRSVVSPAVFGPSNVRIHRVALPVELGDPVTALHQAARVTSGLSTAPAERYGRYMIDVARAARLAAPPEALSVLLRAEQVAPEETRQHRLTGLVLTDLLALGHCGRTPSYVIWPRALELSIRGEDPALECPHVARRRRPRQRGAVRADPPDGAGRRVAGRVDEPWGRPGGLGKLADELGYAWMFVPAFEYRGGRVRHGA